MRLKSVVLIAALSLIAFSANAECKIGTVKNNEIHQIFFKTNGGWEFSNYETVCAKLSRARARIQISGMATVLDTKSIAFVTLSVLDRDTNIGTSSFGSINVKTHPYGSQDKAEELLVAVINEAAEDWRELDLALERLETERKKARAMHAKLK